MSDVMLARYDAACQALAAAKSIDEASQIRNTAEALRAYARQAKNRQLEVDAAEIRIRAERRVGELMAAQRETVGLHEGGRPPKTGSNLDPVSRPVALADAGIDKHLADRARKLAAVPKAEFEGMVGEWRERVQQETERVTTNLLKAGEREQRHAQAEQSLAREQAVVDAARQRDFESVCDLRVCSCADLFASGIKPDAVITDPPYPAEFLNCFSELAEGCKAAAVPLVAVMSGQMYLPEVMRRLSAHLRYRWTVAYLTPGGQAVQVWPAKAITFWKPVLVFGEAVEWFGDVSKSDINDNDKRFHEWGQSESGIADLVERLTKPGQLICDPFLGGGTTAKVALALGRRFVGCDVDAALVTQTKARLAA